MTFISLFVLWLVEDIGQSALAAVLTVEVSGHEDSGSAFLSGTLAPQTVDLAIVINLNTRVRIVSRTEEIKIYLVVLQDSQLDLPVLVLDLLGCGVVLLLPLLGASSQSEDKVEGGLLLDVVVGQGPTILQLLTSEDQSRQNILEQNILSSSIVPLLVWRDSLLVLDLSLDILNGVRGLDLKSDSFTGEGLNEDLHLRPFLLLKTKCGETFHFISSVSWTKTGIKIEETVYFLAFLETLFLVLAALLAMGLAGAGLPVALAILAALVLRFLAAVSSAFFLTTAA